MKFHRLLIVAIALLAVPVTVRAESAKDQIIMEIRMRLARDERPKKELLYDLEAFKEKAGTVGLSWFEKREVNALIDEEMAKVEAKVGKIEPIERQCREIKRKVQSMETLMGRLAVAAQKNSKSEVCEVYKDMQEFAANFGPVPQECNLPDLEITLESTQNSLEIERKKLRCGWSLW